MNDYHMTALADTRLAVQRDEADRQRLVDSAPTAPRPTPAAPQRGSVFARFNRIAVAALRHGRAFQF